MLWYFLAAMASEGLRIIVTVLGLVGGAPGGRHRASPQDIFCASVLQAASPLELPKRQAQLYRSVLQRKTRYETSFEHCRLPVTPASAA